jgi:hypothetical protein
MGTWQARTALFKEFDLSTYLLLLILIEHVPPGGEFVRELDLPCHIRNIACREL